MPLIRLLIADDHTLFREGLRAIFDAQAEIEIVGEAANGAQAVELATAQLPDIILMDIQMPEMNGIAATEKILDANPHIGIIVLTMLEDDDSVIANVRTGDVVCRGTLTVTPQELAAGTKTVTCEGGSVTFSFTRRR